MIQSFIKYNFVAEWRFYFSKFYLFVTNLTRLKKVIV